MTCTTLKFSSFPIALIKHSNETSKSLEKRETCDKGMDATDGQFNATFNSDENSLEPDVGYGTKL